MEKTIWTEKIERTRPEPSGIIQVDVAIIGGGVAGIMAAEALCESGQKVAVLEADCVAGGESAKSSAMVSFAHDDIYTRLIAKHGKAKAKEYLALNKRGLERIKRCIENYKIDCGWQECDMVLFSTTEVGKKNIRKQKRAYEVLGEHTELIDTANESQVELPFPITAGLRIKSQGKINPYKFVSRLASALENRGVKIFEGVRVTSAPVDNELSGNGWTVRASKFVIATHFPYIDFPGWYFIKMYQSRNYNVAFKCDRELKDVYESIEDDGFEYRSISDGILMCGGAGMRTGRGQSGGRYEIVENEIERSFGIGKDGVVQRFAAQDCITFDLLPFVGQYGGSDDSLYVVSGFNKWGFTNAAASAEILSAIIAGEKPNNIFTPARLYMSKSPLKVLRNFGTVIAGYLSRLAGTEKNADIDLKCPHLGCGLKWNADDKSWDCPCHGSRFDPDGNIISNPTTKCACRSKKSTDPFF